MRRLKLWNQWRKRCINPWYQKILVLFGIIKSPTFEFYYMSMEDDSWFDKMYPGGLLELMRKRQIKRFGEDYVKTLEKLGKRMTSAGASYFLSVPPDLARARKLQANLHGQRAVFQPVDDAACLTEEDKKRLLQEFAEG